METPSAAIVYTGVNGGARGDNSGGAVVFDQPSDVNSSELLRRKLADEARYNSEARKERARAEQARAKISNPIKADTAWSKFGAEQAREYEMANAELGKMRVDPNFDENDIAVKKAEFEGHLNQLGQDLGETKKMYDQFKQSSQKALDNPMRYHVEEVEKKNAELDALLEKGDYEGVKSYLGDPKNTPVMAKVNFNDVVKNSTPKYTKTDNGTYSVESIDPKAVDELIEIQFGGTGDESEKAGEEAMQSLIKQGYGKNEEEVKAAIREAAFARNPTRRTKKGESNLNINNSYGSGGNWNGAFNVQYSSDKGTDYAQGANTITISKSSTNDNLPVIAVLSDPKKMRRKNEKGETEDYIDRELINFQPVEFKLRADGGISVRGISDGEDVWVNYDENEDKFLNQLKAKDGTIFDVREAFKAQQSGAGNAGKTETKTTKKFKGVPQGGF